VLIAGTNNQQNAMGTTTYAGIRRRGHDGCRFAARSTVKNFHFYCDLSQLDLMSQITGEAATKPVPDTRALHEALRA